jgi:uncharacterized protein YjbJ (UPF0337 family)
MHDKHRVEGAVSVNWDQLEGQWKQRRGKAVHHWGKIMNDELAAIAGKYEEVVGKLQESYGMAKDEARMRVSDFKRAVEQLKKSNARLMELQKSLKKNISPEKTVQRVKKAAKKQLHSRRSRLLFTAWSVRQRDQLSRISF